MVVSRMIFIIVLLCFVPSRHGEEMNRFSTKTPYIFTKQPSQNYPNFELKKAWAILRHGTRFPSKKVISRYDGLIAIRDEMLMKSKSLSDKQRSAFQRWNPMEIKLDHQKFLTKQGEHEHFQLGARFRERFPSLFEGSPSANFKHTPTQRTEVSAEKFIEGLFPDRIGMYNSAVVKRDDPILRPYKGCTLWRKTVKKNKTESLKEKRAFEASTHVENLLNEFKEFTQIDHLTIEDVELIYTICGFETSWQYQLLDGNSVWCSIFQKDQMKVMEYLEDLEYYWIDGPGFEITRKVACKTVEDIFNQLEQEDGKKMSFYFTHSGTILKLLTFLELYRDEFNLTASNFRDDRLWKTSFIDMFASNLYVILFESEEHGPHVQLLHQEQVINIPECRMNKFGMCPYEEFRNIYMAKVKSCKLQELCQVKDEL